MILAVFFAILGGFFGWSYFFGRERFSPAKLLAALWSLGIGLAQLRLSSYEESWPLKFWLVLGVFFGLFGLGCFMFSRFFRISRFFQSKLFSSAREFRFSRFCWVLTVLTAVSLAANGYIFWRFGTFPIFASQPDRLRFIINREVFGLWEYLALAPRLIIPLGFLGLVFGRPARKLKPVAVGLLAIGAVILLFYASRLIIILPILLSYFSYLILHPWLTKKRIVKITAAVVLVVLAVSIIIPAVRNYISYRDYYSEIDYTPFTYLLDISKINLPEQLDWLVPIYLIPAFNLQALARAVEYFNWPNFFFGRFSLAVFDPALGIFQLPAVGLEAPWEEIFLPWWVTGTFLFGSWVDFGWFGIGLAAIFWAGLFLFSYHWGKRKKALVPALIFGYSSFLAVMAIYTNCFLRPEFYLDLAVIFIVGWLAGGRFFLLEKKQKNSPEKN